VLRATVTCCAATSSACAPRLRLVALRAFPVRQTCAGTVCAFCKVHASADALACEAGIECVLEAHVQQTISKSAENGLAIPPAALQKRPRRGLTGVSCKNTGGPAACGSVVRVEIGTHLSHSLCLRTIENAA
jgi:hypothetical protein